MRFENMRSCSSGRAAATYVLCKARAPTQGEDPLVARAEREWARKRQASLDSIDNGTNKRHGGGAHRSSLPCTARSQGRADWRHTRLMISTDGSMISTDRTMISTDGS